MKKGKKKGEFLVEKKKHRAMQGRRDKIAQLHKGVSVEMAVWRDRKKVIATVNPIPVNVSESDGCNTKRLRWLDGGEVVLCLFNRRLRVLNVQQVTSSHWGDKKRRVEVYDVFISGFVSFDEVIGIVTKVVPLECEE